MMGAVERNGVTPGSQQKERVGASIPMYSSPRAHSLVKTYNQAHLLDPPSALKIAFKV